MSSAWVEIYDDRVIRAGEFEQATGIGGFDWGEVPAASWYVDLHFAENWVESFRGEVVVEGVDIDGRLTGIEGAVIGTLATFDFR